VQGNKTPMIIGLVVVIVAVVGFLIYQIKGSGAGGGGGSAVQENIARQSRSGPGFTPAPR
jgi:hypothetical protein